VSSTPQAVTDASETATPAPARLALIAAVARNGCIGRGNGLVFRHPDDARWFRQQTLGCPVLMGRKTWDSLPPKFRPLPGRSNIVVTRQAGWQAEGAQVAHSLGEALALGQAAAAASGAQKVFVIGGAQLYAEALPQADELVLTEVQADYDGDAWFPDWPRLQFAEHSRQPQAAGAGTGAGTGADSGGTPAFDFVVYRRRG